MEQTDIITVKYKLEELANSLRLEAYKDTVKPRREALVAVAEKLEALASGRYVTRLSSCYGA